MEKQMKKSNSLEINERRKKKWIIASICVVIALGSLFVISKWATSIETYRGVIETLDGLQKRAFKMSGTAIALATGAAIAPGDATTPIANELADVSGYMVIVYAAIMLEKYLLTLTGFIAFKILLPIGFLITAIGGFLCQEWKSLMYRLAIKCIVLGLLLWCLVPTSVWLTNWINDTYANSYSISAEVLGENEEMLEDDGTNLDEDPEQGAIYVNGKT